MKAALAMVAFAAAFGGIGSEVPVEAEWSEPFLHPELVVFVETHADEMAYAEGACELMEVGGSRVYRKMVRVVLLSKGGLPGKVMTSWSKCWLS